MNQFDLIFLCEDSLSLSSSLRLQKLQRKSIFSNYSGFALMPAHSRWYHPEPLHLLQLLHWIQKDSWMILPQIHFYSSQFSSAFPRLISFSPTSASFSRGLLPYFSFRWSSPLFFCAWQMFSSSRSLRTTRSRLKELKKARSVRDWIWSGLMARIWKVCYRCWITLLFSGTSAILEWDELIVSRKSSSSYIVFMVFFMFQKSSLQLGFVFINLITSSRCCTGTAKPNFNNAKCSIFTAPLMIQLQPKTTTNHIHITHITSNFKQIYQAYQTSSIFSYFSLHLWNIYEC